MVRIKLQPEGEESKYRFYYYELIACKIYGIDPRELFLRTRKGRVPKARHLCLYYRYVTLGLTGEIAALRYDQEHCMAVHVKNRFEFYIEKYKDFATLVEGYLKDCEVARKMSEIDIQAMVENMTSPLGLPTALSMSFSSLIHYIGIFLSGGDTDDMIISQIYNCRKELDKLEQYLRPEDEILKPPQYVIDYPGTVGEEKE